MEYCLPNWSNLYTPQEKPNFHQNLQKRWKHEICQNDVISTE